MGIVVILIVLFAGVYYFDLLWSSNKRVLERLKVVEEALDMKNIKSDSLVKERVENENSSSGSRGKLKIPVNPKLSKLSTKETAVIQHLNEKNEFKISAKWLTVTGIVILGFGVSFFLKYAFDHNLITEFGRVLLGILAGIGLVVTGETLKIKYKEYAGYITGAGFGLIYLSLFAAYSFYDLLDQPTTYILMFATVAAAVFMSFKNDSKLLQIVSMAGGYFTPFLIGGIDGRTTTLVYVGLIAGLSQITSYMKKWNVISVVNFVASSFLFLVLLGEYDFTKTTLIVYSVFLVYLWSIFTVPSIVRIEETNKKLDPEHVFITVTSFFVLILGGYFLFHESSTILAEYDYVWALIPSIFFSVKVALNYAINKAKQKQLNYGFIQAMALVSLSAIPLLKFGASSISSILLIEAVTLGLVGYYNEQKLLKQISLGFLGLAVFRIIFFDVFRTYDSFDHLKSVGEHVNIWFNMLNVTYILAIATSFMHTFFFVKDGEKKSAKAMGVVSNLMILAVIFIHIVVLTSFRGFSEYAASMTISLIYIAYAVLIIYIGVVKRYSSFRIFGIWLIAFVVAKTFLYDLLELSEIYRIIEFIFIGAALMTLGFLYTKHTEEIKQFLKDD